MWLVEAAAVGARGIEARMADAVVLTKVIGTARVDEALQIAAMAGRFARGRGSENGGAHLHLPQAAPRSARRVAGPAARVTRSR